MNAQDMTCEEVIQQLFNFLDNELDSAHGARIYHHLERCRDCFTRVEFERRLRSMVNEAAEEKAPDHLRRRIRHMLDEF